jgi:hypothetical protein
VITKNTSAALRPAAALVTGLSAALCAGTALAGPTLVSRESGLRATGFSAAGEYNLSNGSGDFDLFADSVRSDDAAAARSRAEQNSLPRLDGATGAFAGALADGAAHAAVDPAATDASASAESDFDLVFRVEGEPALVRLNCQLAAAGDGTAGFKLYDTVTLKPAFSDEVSADNRAAGGEQTLAPGTYGVSAWAFVRGTPDASSATYSINLTVAADASQGPGPVPMPLPAGVWGGLGVFVIVAGATARVRRRVRAAG